MRVQSSSSASDHKNRFRIPLPAKPLPAELRGKREFDGSERWRPACTCVPSTKPPEASWGLRSCLPWRIPPCALRGVFPCLAELSLIHI